MLTCVAVFMSFLIEFQHGNCCWDAGRFGWFFNTKSNPMGAWFDIENPKFFKQYGPNKSTIYFDVVRDRMTRTDAKLFDYGKCSLDGKQYHYYKYSVKE